MYVISNLHFMEYSSTHIIFIIQGIIVMIPLWRHLVDIVKKGITVKHALCHRHPLQMLLVCTHSYDICTHTHDFVVLYNFVIHDIYVLHLRLSRLQDFP